MSKAGIKRASQAMSELQTARHELLSMFSAGDMSSEEAKQDLLLANLMEDAKEAVKDRFNRITFSP